MSTQQYLDEMQNVQKTLLDFLENETDVFQNFITKLHDLKIIDDEYKFKSFLYLLSEIINHHHSDAAIFDKAKSLLRHFQKDIKKYYSNLDIFSIFHNNKKILLFLLNEKMIIMDQYIANAMTNINRNYNYISFFAPELEPFIEYSPHGNEYFINLKQREIGENESEICKIIREDKIEDFIIYINKTNYNLNSQINLSIYETNSFLIEREIKRKKTSLISYSAFFGSIRIFNYLKMNGAELTPSILLYAIYGQNQEIIFNLEQEGIKLDGTNEEIDYKEFIFESIKCHYIEMTKFLLDNYDPSKEEDKNTHKHQYDYDDEIEEDSIINEPLEFRILVQSLENYNFAFIQNELLNNDSFRYLCKYDYFIIVDLLLKNKDIDINEQKKDDNWLNKTALYIAFDNQKTDIVKLLLANDKTDLNIIYVYILFYI